MVIHITAKFDELWYKDDKTFAQITIHIFELWSKCVSYLVCKIVQILFIRSNFLSFLKFSKLPHWIIHIRLHDKSSTWSSIKPLNVSTCISVKALLDKLRWVNWTSGANVLASIEHIWFPSKFNSFKWNIFWKYPCSSRTILLYFRFRYSKFEKWPKGAEFPRELSIICIWLASNETLLSRDRFANDCKLTVLISFFSEQNASSLFRPWSPPTSILFNPFRHPPYLE